MGKGLIISNHTLLSDIYALNLKFYTDSRVIIRKTVDEGLKHLKEPGVRFRFCSVDSNSRRQESSN